MTAVIPSVAGGSIKPVLSNVERIDFSTTVEMTKKRLSTWGTASNEFFFNIILKQIAVMHTPIKLLAFAFCNSKINHIRDSIFILSTLKDLSDD